MKSMHGTESDKIIHVTSHVASPVQLEDGSWDVVMEEIEEDIPDLGREELICNCCGWSDYPKCKETFCKAWIHHTLEEHKKNK